MIEREKMVKIEQEIRNVVDEMMRNELELLQAAYDKDKAVKGKKSKKPQKKVKYVFFLANYHSTYLRLAIDKM